MRANACVTVHVGIWTSILRLKLVLDSLRDRLGEVLNVSVVKSGHGDTTISGHVYVSFLREGLRL